MNDELQGFDPKATYSAAAEDYARVAPRFWQFLTTRTIDRLGLRPGERVLDAACGTGPATTAAAQLVGPTGEVVGVDYAEGMLALARRNVDAAQLTNVRLTPGDMRALPFTAEFDVVVCVLGIFFVDDMAAAVRSLWGAVRPGGRLAVTTFGAEVWTPVLAQFVGEVAKARPDIERVLPWRRTEDPAVLRRVLEGGGVERVQVAQEVVDVPFTAHDWRAIVMGSGLRRMAVDLGDALDEVMARTERWVRDEDVTSVRVSMNLASAARP